MADAARVRHSLPAGVTLRAEQNGLIMPRSWNFITERPDHPGLVALREREKLDAVVAPGADEWAKMRLLCSWANSQFAMGAPDPYPPWDANAALEMIRSGRTGGYCAQYAVVFVQACAAMGWPARYLDIKPLDPKDGYGHITVEVWSNQFNRWVVLDPTMDATFELDGRPLSALEVHEALVNGRAERVKLVHGGGKHGQANVKPSEAQVVKFFFHLAADLRADHLSRPLHFWDRGDGYLAWRDGHTDGFPNVYLRFTADPFEFNFPLNQVQARLKGWGSGALQGQLRTNMAHAVGFELMRGGGKWEMHNSPFSMAGDPELKIVFTRVHGPVISYRWELAPGANRLQLRAVDGMGNRGPTTLLAVDYDPAAEQSAGAAPASGSTEE